MEQGFYITWDAIVKIGAILSTLAIIVSFIIKGIKTFDQISTIIQPKVKAVLEALDLGELTQ